MFVCVNEISYRVAVLATVVAISAETGDIRPRGSRVVILQGSGLRGRTHTTS